MTTPDIDALREAARTALEGATPGEWQAYQSGRLSGHYVLGSGPISKFQRHDLPLSEQDAAAIVAAVNYLRSGGLDEARTLAARVRKLEQAGRYILPYLDFTISSESPGHHPTMPSAVEAFRAALAVQP